MSHKKNKKLRQMYGREVRKQAAETVAHWNQVIKPKPRWMPGIVYRWCLHVVLR